MARKKVEKPARGAFDEETPRKIAVFSAMAKMISENWPGWELVANIREKEPYPGVGQAIRSVALYSGKKLMDWRMVAPESSACRIMQDISGAFAAALQRAGEEK